MISSHKMIYNIFGFGIYHKLHSIFKSKYQEVHNNNIGIFLSKMILGWLDISWGCTDTYVYGNLLKPLYRLLSSSVFLIITNSPKQLVTFMTISHGEYSIYFSRFFFFVLEFFALQIVILQEWTKFITIQ